MTLPADDWQSVAKPLPASGLSYKVRIYRNNNATTMRISADCQRYLREQAGMLDSEELRIKVLQHKGKANLVALVAAPDGRRVTPTGSCSAAVFRTLGWHPTKTAPGNSTELILEPIPGALVGVFNPGAEVITDIPYLPPSETVPETDAGGGWPKAAPSPEELLAEPEHDDEDPDDDEDEDGEDDDDE